MSIATTIAFAYKLKLTLPVALVGGASAVKVCLLEDEGDAHCPDNNTKTLKLVI